MIYEFRDGVFYVDGVLGTEQQLADYHDREPPPFVDPIAVLTQTLKDKSLIADSDLQAAMVKIAVNNGS